MKKFKMIYFTKKEKFQGEDMIAFYLIGGKAEPIEKADICCYIPTDKTEIIENKHKELKQLGYKQI